MRDAISAAEERAHNIEDKNRDRRKVFDRSPTNPDDKVDRSNGMSYARWACLPGIYEKKVNPGSKAAQQGVREGDLITSINGESTRDLSNSESHSLLRNAGNRLRLGLNQENASPKKRVYKSLLEKTSIETIEKITTKTTTNTQIISEIRKNGVDANQNCNPFECQNGNVKETDILDACEDAQKTEDKGIWSPGGDPPKPIKHPSPVKDVIPTVWTPSSAGPSPVPDRKEFRSVPFESPQLGRKKYPEQPAKSDGFAVRDSKRPTPPTILSPPSPSRSLTSPTSPTHSLNNSDAPRLPRAQNPTITLLQKAREGQLPKGAAYLEETDDRFKSKLQEERHRYTPNEYNLRPNCLSSSGYTSEPEHSCYSDRSSTLDSNRRQPTSLSKDYDYSSISTIPRQTGDSVKYFTDYRLQPGKIEDYVPGRSSIQEKETKEWWAEVMDVFDGPFEQSHANFSKSYMTHALKESGYESDSTLVFRRREVTSPLALSPIEQRLAYKTIQKGGDVPLQGLRKPAPERPKEYSITAPTPPPKAHHYRSGERQESPRRYVEGEVTIHYRSPVRSEAKEPLSEEELTRRTTENMRRLYQEEKRRKYLQELHDIDSRRHTDNFTPLQKSPISLNRYDDFVDDISYRSESQEQTPEPRLVARALYNFVGQSPRELTFRRGDLIFVRRQVDRNWYEGEHNAMVGLFPFNYVEILPYDEVRTLPKKSSEGQARAKFNFIAQTNLELSLAKGEIVSITRRVDENWYEGRIGNRKGIFPCSYVEVINEPGIRPETPMQSKPVGSPAAHTLLTNGKASGKLSMGPHHYTPSMMLNLNQSQSHYNSLPKTVGSKSYMSSPITEALPIETHSEPIPYRVLYNYRPQNEDELELKEGDTVLVMEKCDDGWYVGSSQRSGYFGTFPGNYVEQL